MNLTLSVRLSHWHYLWQLKKKEVGFSPKLLPTGLNNSYPLTPLSLKRLSHGGRISIKVLRPNSSRLDLKQVKSCRTHRIQKERARFHRKGPLTLRGGTSCWTQPGREAFRLTRDSSTSKTGAASHFLLEWVASSAIDYRSNATYIRARRGLREPTP